MTFLGAIAIILAFPLLSLSLSGIEGSFRKHFQRGAWKIYAHWKPCSTDIPLQRHFFLCSSRARFNAAYD